MTVLAEHRQPDAHCQRRAAPGLLQRHRRDDPGPERLRAGPPSVARDDPRPALGLAREHVAVAQRDPHRLREPTERRARLAAWLGREQPLGLVELDEQQRQREPSSARPARSRPGARRSTARRRPQRSAPTAGASAHLRVGRHALGPKRRRRARSRRGAVVAASASSVSCFPPPSSKPPPAPPPAPTGPPVPASPGVALRSPRCGAAWTSVRATRSGGTRSPGAPRPRRRPAGAGPRRARARRPATAAHRRRRARPGLSAPARSAARSRSRSGASPRHERRSRRCVRRRARRRATRAARARHRPRSAADPPRRRSRAPPHRRCEGPSRATSPAMIAAADSSGASSTSASSQPLARLLATQQQRFDSFGHDRPWSPTAWHTPLHPASFTTH